AVGPPAGRELPHAPRPPDRVAPARVGERTAGGEDAGERAQRSDGDRGPAPHPKSVSTAPALGIRSFPWAPRSMCRCHENPAVGVENRHIGGGIQPPPGAAGGPPAPQTPAVGGVPPTAPGLGAARALPVSWRPT